MSRIGKQSIKVPDKVKVALAGSVLKIEGPKGKAELPLPPHVEVKVVDKQVTVSRGDESRESRSLHGLTRSLINNFIQGVATGYQRQLEINGVGFKAEVRGTKDISFSIGFSHPVVFPLPQGVTAEWRENKTAEKQGDLFLKSHDKDLLGRTAAKVRALRPPEPYKGKGIRYADETVRRKVGKTGAA
jgi:large subunit ribosomal protein L6